MLAKKRRQSFCIVAYSIPDTYSLKLMQKVDYKNLDKKVSLIILPTNKRKEPISSQENLIQNLNILFLISTNLLGFSIQV